MLWRASLQKHLSSPFSGRSIHQPQAQHFFLPFFKVAAQHYNGPAIFSRLAPSPRSLRSFPLLASHYSKNARYSRPNKVRLFNSSCSHKSTCGKHFCEARLRSSWGKESAGAEEEYNYVDNNFRLVYSVVCDCSRGVRGKMHPQPPTTRWLSWKLAPYFLYWQTVLREAISFFEQQ